MWQDACRAFSASMFNVARGIRVKFIGESRVDGGGPRREFYRLLVEAVCSTSGLLEGSDRNKIPLHNCVALKAKKFFLLQSASKLLRHSYPLESISSSVRKWPPPPHPQDNVVFFCFLRSLSTAVQH